ncbi:ladderlectin-like isoform X2 [Epinephelus moara]|uniref:ladderlectin-like isoform X2 n=1 Tax=Epinephelus moara TaxID=300413 RepID=UPI00214F261C|nr:ladderlectin-like isoform X2 [Epinephelus moara]
MKTVLVLSILLCAAFAAPQPEGEKTNEEKAPEMDKMMKDEEVLVPEEFVPVPRNAPVSEEAAASESRYSLCPRGWEQHGSRCFRVISTSKTWYEAKEHCNILGAHLASATNAREYSFLQQMTQLRGLTSAWLGGLYLQGQWMWIDQEGFTRLYSLPSPSSYPCIYLRSTYGWCNAACGTAFPFICSKMNC